MSKFILIGFPLKEKSMGTTLPQPLAKAWTRFWFLDPYVYKLSCLSFCFFLSMGLAKTLVERVQDWNSLFTDSREERKPIHFTLLSRDSKC